MQEMLTFSTSMLEAVATFLSSEPMIYLFALVCFAFVIKMFRQFLP